MFGTALPASITMRPPDPARPPVADVVNRNVQLTPCAKVAVVEGANVRPLGLEGATKLGELGWAATVSDVVDNEIVDASVPGAGFVSDRMASTTLWFFAISNPGVIRAVLLMKDVGTHVCWVLAVVSSRSMQPALGKPDATSTMICPFSAASVPVLVVVNPRRHDTPLAPPAVVVGVKETPVGAVAATNAPDDGCPARVFEVVDTDSAENGPAAGLVTPDALRKSVRLAGTSAGTVTVSVDPFTVAGTQLNAVPSVLFCST
jgi:hypothetical protein